ncbi:uncharacterized protein NECHADRAFT_65667 [Fusarium vanettenii 77-13-4]|uniref:Uncharacterized protein n=1 Tax=Fusarium vanettenii (strain ATCC MYA-4622 / CBS 123669 / FGSC 9596 / NRRL 45880 / 77-13-4) TaxID=660122 RepID=C7YHB7_FUSV7|nr:uncharacterized protein NECHADRAFT_65667 [Fusarium vanettenii 77-13-4]EEU47891.1 hypothetical protein NECHADRAFT_65667 [Fusarium vanettenii 77-13-4]
MPLRRPSTSGDGHSVASSSPSFSLAGTKRRFPLLGRKKTRNSDLPRPSSVVLPSTSSSQTQKLANVKPGLRVHVQVKFESPIGTEHVRDYEASPQLKASDRICQALLSRLQHCSAELITRHDSTALDPLRKPHRDVKPLRYRITYRVERDGLILVEKSLRSFQEYELTHDDAREVVNATDRIVGLFLVRHDPGFRWSDAADPEPANAESETVRPCTGRPQSTACIPRSRFANDTQSFELVSGYAIELFLRSRCATRYPENRNASIKIDSRQPSPLTLLLGEELMTRVSNLVIDPVDSCKRKFDKRHKTCNGFEGSGGCTHTEDGAVDIMVKVRNNLGPDYTYFSHRIQTSKVLFNDPQGRDFDEFANQVKAKLEKARDMTDKSMRSLDDLTLTIRELRGKNWSVHEPLVVRLDHSVTYCRQTIEAVMERLQTGISNVLEHHEDALATMTVHKRGHLIFDGFLDGAGGDDSIPLEKFASPDLERKALEAHLKERIRSDITMLCKDTCAIDCPDTLPNLRLKSRGAAASSIGAASSIVPPPSIGATSSVAPTPSLTASASLPRPESEVSMSGSLGSSRSEHTLSKKIGQTNLRDSPQAPPSPAAPSPDLRRVPSGLEMAKKNGYMADFADDENQSEPPSTPSLVDTDSISPRDSIVVTPKSSRALAQDQSNEGLRIIDDGRRIIYQEQSDMDAIASGVVQFHRPINDDDEPIQLTKEPPIESPERRAARRSLDTRMPDLSGGLDSPSAEPKRDDAPAAPEKESVDLVVPQVVEPTEAPASTAQKNETPHTSQDEQWEMVDARDAPSDPQAIVPHTRSETSFGTTPPASLPAEKTEVDEKELANESEVQTPKANPVALEVTESDNASKEPQEETVLSDFPKPPSTHSHAEEPQSKEPTEPVVEASTVDAPKQEPSEEPAQEKVVESEGAVIPEEPKELSHKAEEALPETVRGSSDSGISMEEQAKEIAKEDKVQTPAVAESAEAESLPSVQETLAVPAAEQASETDAPKVEITESPEVAQEMLATPLETVLEEIPDSAVTDGSESPNLEPSSALRDGRGELPRIASAPLNALPTSDYFRTPPASEKDQAPAPPSIDSSNLPLVLARPRPRTNTLPSRRYSTALTLDIEAEPFHRDGDESPTGEPPKSASGVWNKDLGHRRQPSAGSVGFVGLQDQRRLHSVGLRSALMPYRWQGMQQRGQGVWEGRPSTSHSQV